jgi:Undecaprenyl-phosphate glucose phosphotransferase
MILTLNRYGLVLRWCTYALPLPAFATAGALLPGFRYALCRSPIYVLLIATTLAVWVAAVEHYQLASTQELFREAIPLRRIVPACGSTFLAVIAIELLGRHAGALPGLLPLSASFLFLYVLGVQHGFGSIVRTRRRRALRVLIVGTDRYARRAVRGLRNPHFPCHVAGYVRLPGQAIEVADAPVYEVADLEGINLDGVNDILIAVGPGRTAKLQELMRRLERFCVPVRLIVDFGAHVVARERIFQFGHLQLLDVERSPAESLAYGVGKRAFDIVFASFAILFCAPVMAAIAIGIKLSSPGPVFFRQERVGRNNRIFTMLKFRSMKVSSALESDTRWTIENDPRRTAFGTMLRATSLDELPQFFNVLRGDMSVVGPRPERPFFVQQFLHDIEMYNSRHRLQVGITGWAQVNGWRGNTSIEKRVEHDLYYLHHWSFALDLRIIWFTVWSGIFHRNAY